MDPIAVAEQLITNVNKILNKNKINLAREIYYYHALERIMCNCYTIKLLMSSQANIRNYEHTIGLTCRNMMSDVFVSYYILVESHSDDEIDEKVKLLFHQDYKKLFSLLNHLKDANGITKEFAYEKEDFESVFGSFDIKGKFPQTSDIIKLLHKGEIEDPPENLLHFILRQSTQYWILLSKYEHIGLNSIRFTRQVDFISTVIYVLGVLRAVSIMTIEILGRINADVEDLKALLLTTITLSEDLNKAYTIKMN